MTKEDLIPYRPGQSGNPSGKPKGAYSVRAALRRFLAEPSLRDSAKTRAEELAEILLDTARTGDRHHVEAIATLIAEAEGRPKEHVEHSVPTRYVIDLGDEDVSPPASLPPPPGMAADGVPLPPARTDPLLVKNDSSPPHPAPLPLRNADVSACDGTQSAVESQGGPADAWEPPGEGYGGG